MEFAAAIIGGSGIASRLGTPDDLPVHVNTAFGILRGREATMGGYPVLLVSRHGAGHALPPHRVAYRAIAAGLATLGVPVCFSTAAVGSLDPEVGPGGLVAVSDLLDFSDRQLTLYTDRVTHTDITHPFAPQARAALMRAASDIGVEIADGGVYINVNGPRYETPHEIQTYRTLGGTVVGMTAGTEAIAMREAGVPYACLAIVSNFASGISPDAISHGEVLAQMDITGPIAVNLLTQAVRIHSEA